MVERGQASAEMLLALPAMLLTVLACVQLLLVGQAQWQADNAASAGVVAAAAGRDAGAAARVALPAGRRHSARILVGRDRIRVGLDVLSPLALVGARLKVEASAGLSGAVEAAGAVRVAPAAPPGPDDGRRGGA